MFIEFFIHSVLFRLTLNLAYHELFIIIILTDNIQELLTLTQLSLFHILIQCA